MRSFIFVAAFLGFSAQAWAGPPQTVTDPPVVKLGVADEPPVVLTEPLILDQSPVPTSQPEHLKPRRTFIVYECEPLWLGKRVFHGGRKLVCGIGQFGQRAVVETLELGEDAVVGTVEFGCDVFTGTGNWLQGVFKPPVYRPVYRIEVYPIRRNYYYKK